MKLLIVLLINCVIVTALAEEGPQPSEIKMRVYVGVSGSYAQNVLEELRWHINDQLPGVPMNISVQGSVAIIAAKMDLKSKSDREALSLMRLYSIGAANCLMLSSDVRNKCVAVAIDPQNWDGINYGDWLANARSGGSVNLFTYRLTMRIEPLTNDQAQLIMNLVNALFIQYHSNPRALPVDIDGIVFKIK